MPEISTAIIAILNDSAELSVGNILGSNLVNLTLVLGIAAIAANHMKIDKNHESSLVKIMFLITGLTGLIFFTGSLNPLHGLVLLATYVGALVWLKRGGLMDRMMKQEQEEAEKELGEEAFSGPYATFAKLVGSTVLVIIGAELTVSSAVSIGELMDVPLEVIGATAVAIGTGLPELSLELNAVKKREYGLALGNIFGSVLVNFTLVLGMMSVVSPVSINVDALIHLLPFLGASLVLIWYTVLKEHEISREVGLALVLFYIIYLFEEIGFIL
jgi:cation:H+ antiporter